MNKIKMVYGIIAFLLLLVLVYAFTPIDNVDLKDRLSVHNATNISSKLFIQKIYTNCNGANAIMTYVNGTEYCGAISGTGANESLTYLQLNSSTYAGIRNESSSYSPIKFGYNMSDGQGSSQLDDIFNGTVKAIIGKGLVNVTSNDVTQNATMTILVTNESGSYTPITWAYNQSDNSQLLFNYNFTLSSLFNYNLTSAVVWVDLRNYPSACPANSYVTQIDDAITCTTVIYNFNQTANYLQINSSTVAGLNNESGSYSPIKFGYNMSDGTGSSQLDDVYNGTVKAIIGKGLVNVTSNDVTQNATMTILVTNESGSYTPITWAYNQSDNSQLLFNYNFTLASLFNYNQSDGNTNFTIDLTNAYSKWWYNQSADAIGWTQAQGYSTSGGDNLVNVAFVNNSNLFTLPNNFTFNLGASIYAMNWSNVTIFRSQIRDNLANESGSYTPIKFGYNQSSASETQFGKFWYNMSVNNFNSLTTNWINGSAGNYIDMGVENAQGFVFSDTSGTYPDFTCKGSAGTNVLCEFPNGAYMSGGNLYITNGLISRGTLYDDGGDLAINDNVTVSGNVTMTAGNLTFNNRNQGVTFNEGRRMYDNGSCLIIQAGSGTLAFCGGAVI